MAWTQRLQLTNVTLFNLTVWDSLAVAAGTYGGHVSIPCAWVNQEIMLALAGAPSLIQTATSIEQPAGLYATATIPFTSPNTGGDALILFATYNAGSYTAGPTSVTDSQGNVWTKIVGSTPAFQGFFFEAWVIYGCSAGANTVTLHMGGALLMNTVTLGVLEYSGLSGITEGSEYVCGPLFGTGQPPDLSLTIPGGDLLLLALSTAEFCPGVTVTGGGVPIASPGQSMGTFSAFTQSQFIGGSK
jgi:hypothetical protein